MRFSSHAQNPSTRCGTSDHRHDRFGSSVTVSYFTPYTQPADAARMRLYWTLNVSVETKWRRQRLTQSGPDASAQSVGRVARLSGNVRQPNHVLANEIAGHKAERRPRAGEEWLAATKYDGVEVKSILINKTKVG